MCEFSESADLIYFISRVNLENIFVVLQFEIEDIGYPSTTSIIRLCSPVFCRVIFLLSPGNLFRRNLIRIFHSGREGSDFR